MNGSSDSPARGSAARLTRDVLVIVLVGVALGTGFNLLQLRAGGGRGLPWIKTERRLASLESLLPPFAAADSIRARGASDSVASAAAPSRDRAETIAPEPASPGQHDLVPSRPTTNEPAPAAIPTATPERATPPAATTPPASAPAAVAPPPPVIPDTREPLEAGDAVVKALHDAGAALFVDARSPEEFAQGHIPGAINLPFDDVFRRPELAKALESGGRPVVAYCGGGDCELSKNLAFALIEGGHRKVLVYLGGTKGWTEAGHTLAKGTPR